MQKNSILAQSCVTPPYIYPGKGVTHECASILDSIAKGTSCFHYFLHGASLHPHSFIFTLVYFKSVQTWILRLFG